MALVCLPTLIPDIQDVYDTYFEAFKGEPIIDILFPGGVDQKFRELHTQGTAEYWKASKSQYTVKCVDTQTGKVVGMGLWDIFFETQPDAGAEGVTWLEGEHRERAEKVLRPLWDKKNELIGSRPHVCKSISVKRHRLVVLTGTDCHVIAVKPSYQRRGAGALLTQWGLDSAERAQLPVYLESSPQARKLYSKLGFQQVDKVIHEASSIGKEHDVEIPLMVKMPSTLDMDFATWRSKYS